MRFTLTSTDLRHLIDPLHLHLAPLTHGFECSILCYSELHLLDLLALWTRVCVLHDGEEYTIYETDDYAKRDNYPSSSLVPTFFFIPLTGRVT